MDYVIYGDIILHAMLTMSVRIKWPNLTLSPVRGCVKVVDLPRSTQWLFCNDPYQVTNIHGVMY